MRLTRAWVRRGRVIIAGHPGDDAHAKLFDESTKKIEAAFRRRFAVEDKRLWIWSGATNDAAGATDGRRGPATREALAAGINELRTVLTKNDDLWVIVIGHAYDAGPTAQLNLPGADVDADEFGKWFADLPCRRSVFLITTPLSGRFVRPLAQPQRVVIAAAGEHEDNETLFHLPLAEMLATFAQAEQSAGPAAGSTLLDLYLAIERDVAARYAADQIVATEHGELDDNGDGRGSELQLEAQYDSRGAQTRLSRKGRAARTASWRDRSACRRLRLKWTSVHREATLGESIYG